MTRPGVWRFLRCLFVRSCELYDEADDPVVQEYRRIIREATAAAEEINARPSGHLIADIVRGVRAPDEPRGRPKQ